MYKFLLLCLLALTVSQARAQLPSYGAYALQCQVGGKFLQVAGDVTWNKKYVDGAKITQGTAGSGASAWQQWYVVPDTVAAGVTYIKLRNVFSGKLLTSPSAVLNDGLVQRAETFALRNQQRWQLVPIPGMANQYRFVNRGSKLAMSNFGLSANDNAYLTQDYARANQLQQRWTFIPLGLVSYRDDVVNGFFRRNNPAQGSTAFDGGASIALADGRVLWTTDDSFDGVNIPNAGMKSNPLDSTNPLLRWFITVQNSVFAQAKVGDWSPTAPNLVNASGGSDYHNRQIFNTPKAIYPNGNRTWPNCGVEINGHVYVECGETGSKKDNATQDALGQTGKAIFDLVLPRDKSYKVANPVRFVPTSWRAAHYGDDEFGEGWVKASDGYVYAYGGGWWNLRVARFKANADSIRSGWSYWDGTKWGRTPSHSKAANISAQATKGNTNVSFVPDGKGGGKYVAVTFPILYGCNQGDTGIYTAVSNSAKGPFSTWKKVYTITEYQYGKHARLYQVNVHPEQVNGTKELLITYCLNFYAPNETACYVAPPYHASDSYFYRLKAVRIPYSLIGLSPTTVTAVRK